MSKINAKMNAEIGLLTEALYDWHCGRRNNRFFRNVAGQVATTEEINRLEAIGKFSYKGVAGLRELVTKAYLGS